MARDIRIGTAGWAIPRQVKAQFPADGTGLQRYAGRLDCAEINTSFYRPHRRETYERWAASVPAGFRFAVKLPKAITHERRLADCEAVLRRFAEEIAGLGAKLGPVLMQLPPKFAFDLSVAPFLDLAGAVLPGALVCEPRHPSWFEPEVDALLERHRIARVAADPAPVPAAAEPGGWRGLGYFRLHGSPRPYWSRYDAEALARWAALVRRETDEAWIVLDNTGSGSAAPNAIELAALLG